MLRKRRFHLNFMIPSNLRGGCAIAPPRRGSPKAHTQLSPWSMTHVQHAAKLLPSLLPSPWQSGQRRQCSRTSKLSQSRLRLSQNRRTAEVTICIISERLLDRPRQLPNASIWGRVTFSSSCSGVSSSAMGMRYTPTLRGESPVPSPRYAAKL